MRDEHETVKIAVGLARRAVALLESYGQLESAERLEGALEAVIDANPWLRGREMSPEDACLAAGIPLSGGFLSPCEEVPPPDLVLRLSPPTAPTEVWPPVG